MKRDEEETCGNYECKTCYPGGVVYIDQLPEQIRLSYARSYEV